MSISRILSAFLWLAGISSTLSQDVIGSTGCTTPACVFSNPNLRFGTGAQDSVNNWGLFVQPWYYSNTANTWYKLTFSSYPLDTAIGTGTGTAQWSGATVVDLYSLTPTNIINNYSNFVVDSSDATKTLGHGKIIATRTFVISGQTITFENTFSLGVDDSFVKITTRVINSGTTILQNVRIWTGTRDDFVGLTDSNTKTRGNLNTGSFVPVTTNTQSSYAIMITNTNEGVLFYSETPGVMTAYAMCCAFSNAYNTNPLSLAPSTPTPTDGSYAAVLPVGDVEVGASASIIWYYAAGAVSSLSAVAQSVAIDQVANAAPASTATSTSSSTGSSTSSSSSSSSVTSSSSSSSSITSSSSSSSSITSSSSSTSSNSSTASFTVAPSISSISSPSSILSSSFVPSLSSMLSPSGILTPSIVESPSSVLSPSDVPSSSLISTVTSVLSPSDIITPSSILTETSISTSSSTSTNTLTSTPTGTNNPRDYSMSLQLNTQAVSTIIAINVATIVVAVSIVLCLGCCIFACYRRHAKPVKCTYCKLDIVNESIDDHLNKCLEYRNSKLKLAEPFRPLAKQAFTEVIAVVDN